MRVSQTDLDQQQLSQLTSRELAELQALHVGVSILDAYCEGSRSAVKNLAKRLKNFHDLGGEGVPGKVVESWLMDLAKLIEDEEMKEMDSLNQQINELEESARERAEPAS